MAAQLHRQSPFGCSVPMCFIWYSLFLSSSVLDSSRTHSVAKDTGINWDGEIDLSALVDNVLTLAALTVMPGM